MTSSQLERLRTLEMELLTLRDECHRLLARLYDVHQHVVEVLQEEFAGPLVP